MHQHQRPPPVTASPARSPKTNPTRTNNPREGEPSRSRPASDRGTPNEQAIDMGEGSEALMRGQNETDPNRDGLQKLNQVVQVRRVVAYGLSYVDQYALELLHQGCPYHFALQSTITSRVPQRH